MRNNKKLKVLTLIVMIVLILSFARNTFAAAQITTIQTSPSISTSTGNSPSNSNVPSNNNVGSIPSNNNVGSIPSNNVTQPTNNANSLEAPRNLPNTTTNTSIPEAGAKSTKILVGLIAIALISTIYTYLKIKKYNI